MIRKGTPLYSILHFKCPYCQEGQFFVSHPYNLKKAGDVLDRCPQCNGRYMIEPAFYFGAMYISYAMGVAIAMGIWAAFALLAPEAAPFWIIASVTVVMLLTGPYLFALSRIIWANMFLAGRGPGGKLPEEE